MTKEAACVDEILRLGLDDWIQAAEVASIAVTLGGATSDAEVQQLSLEIIREVISQGLMTAGDVSPGGFMPWALDQERAIVRIQTEWVVPGRPGLGDICWLSNTEAGDARGRSVIPPAE